MKLVRKIKIEIAAGDKRHVFDIYWRCEDCGARVAKSDIYCRNCGNKFVDTKFGG